MRLQDVVRRHAIATAKLPTLQLIYALGIMEM
jgi:hypothetical protein